MDVKKSKKNSYVGLCYN